MGYRIEYIEGYIQREKDKIHLGRVIIYSGICFAFLCLLTAKFWPEGAEVLSDWLYPGDTAVTRQALLHMASQIRAGENVKDAVFVFCREILDSVKVSG